MYNLYKKMGLIKNFRLRRPQCMGHVLRMKDERAPRKSTETIHRRKKTDWKAQKNKNKLIRMLKVC
jgi:hypothetical protein